MEIVIVLAIAAAALLVLASLVRGLVHFARTSNSLANGTDGVSEGHLMQNRMMFARVKWQAVTIVLLVILGAVASGN
ncbi:MAG: HIG1 domain-containing protein [Sphingopyxis sp.]|jgi:hypothetical protein|nr:HIG1 domain-containing protein [Sphingopyxis sp.]